MQNPLAQSQFYVQKLLFFTAKSGFFSCEKKSYFFRPPSAADVKKVSGPKVLGGYEAMSHQNPPPGYPLPPHLLFRRQPRKAQSVRNIFGLQTQKHYHKFGAPIGGTPSKTRSTASPLAKQVVGVSRDPNLENISEFANRRYSPLFGHYVATSAGVGNSSAGGVGYYLVGGYNANARPLYLGL